MGDYENYNLGSDDDDEIRNFYEFSGPDDDEFDDEDEYSCQCRTNCVEGQCNCSSECECAEDYCDCLDFAQPCGCEGECSLGSCDCDDYCECIGDDNECCKTFRDNAEDLRREEARSAELFGVEITIENDMGEKYRSRNSKDVSPAASQDSSLRVFDLFGKNTYDFWVIGDSPSNSVHGSDLTPHLKSSLAFEVKTTFSRAVEIKMHYPDLFGEGEIGYAIPTESRQQSLLVYKLLRFLCEKYDQACLIRFLDHKQIFVPVLDPSAQGFIYYSFIQGRDEEKPSDQWAKPDSHESSGQDWLPF